MQTLKVIVEKYIVDPFKQSQAKVDLEELLYQAYKKGYETGGFVPFDLTDDTWEQLKQQFLQ